jgi:DNA polymerase-3 subunit delta
LTDKFGRRLVVRTGKSSYSRAYITIRSAMPPRKKTTRTTEPSRIFAIIGSDEGETKRRARELAWELTPKSGADFGLNTIDGAVDNAEQAFLRIHQAKEAIQTLPLFGREKLVWLKNVNFLADTVTGRSATVQEALEEFREYLGGGLPEGVRFLLSASEVDKQRSFYKSLGKVAKVDQFDRARLFLDYGVPLRQAGVALKVSPPK